MGDIGKEKERKILEPLEEPAVAPVEQPAVPVEEPVPA